ncbi:MAG: invasion associated locus B family protein [Telmatospirillum sp.]|nr:invasion associated locus B family protein [Telmatospirillum sp.]
MIGFADFIRRPNRAAAAIVFLVALAAGMHDAAAQQRPPAAGPGRPPAEQAPTVREQAFQDWRYRCLRTAANQPEQCVAFIEILLPDTNQRLANFAVVVVPGQPTPVGTLTLPLGLFLPAGIQIAIDGQNPLAAPLTTCVAEGCQVSLNLDAGILPRMQAGKQANITFVDNSGERRAITINLSLAGFAQALAALRR